MNNFDLKKFLVENKLTTASKLNEGYGKDVKQVTINGKTYEIGDIEPEEQGNIIGIRQFEKGFAVDSMLGSEGYTYHYNLQGELSDEDTVEGDGMNENDLSTQQIASNEGLKSNMDKYLKMESAQAILSELENEIALAGLDLRKEQIQGIIQEIEAKISTLEEDAGMQGFVDKTAINEKRKVVKELNKAYEKVNKLSEKMHAKRKKKMK